ncbi:MAG: hypothetical protein K9K66_07870 [Desulfarculaceae bacterium]|nr:hypothetical protein [Desulfarculaceae bacterium]MCF8072042.1 hypothetical protein [Desulfarculaceae bacterium]MCF8101559.1 hypothetical protein [Desulfarculaceae bacterium]MCF8115109.1 hypothetical protein [Desulfarculaceae bacterium]
MTTVIVKTRAERYNLEAAAVWIGSDLLVYVWGGESPHIGAVAMATPRPSLADPARTSSTASVFTYLGHKEDRLAQAMAERLSSKLGVKVVLTAGIHWDGLAREAIEMVEANSHELVELLLAELSA